MVIAMDITILNREDERVQNKQTLIKSLFESLSGCNPDPNIEVSFEGYTGLSREQVMEAPVIHIIAESSKWAEFITTTCDGITTQ